MEFCLLQQHGWTWRILNKKRCKSDRERQIQYDITYMWNPKKQSKLVDVTKKKQTHRYREQTSSQQWGEGSGEAKYRVGD